MDICRQKTILIVEDEAIIAMSEAATLEKYGYKAIIVNNGERAVQAVIETPDIDLILMDINLGNGMDGTQAAEIILGKHNLPVIFLSSHTERKVVEKTEGITSYGYIVKDSGETVLIASIKMAFRLFEAKQKEIEKEIALRKSEEQLKAFFRYIPSLVLLKDNELRIIHANEKYKTLFPFDDWKEKKPEEAFPKDVAAYMISKDNEALDRGYVKYEEDWRDIKGIRHTFQTEKFKIEMPDNKPLLGAIITDITDRKRAEKALRESEERLSGFMDSAADCFFLLDSNLNLVQINKRGTEIIGRRKEDIIGKNIADLIPDVKESARYKQHLELIRSGKPFVTDHFFHHPMFGDMHFVLNSFKAGDGVGVIAHDITERKKAEEELRVFMESVENSSDAIGMSTPEGKHYYQNRAFDQLFGKLGDMPPTKVFVDEKIGKDVFRIVMAGGHYIGEVEMYARDGKIVNTFLRAYAGKDTDGRIKALVGVFTDITERKRADEANRKSLKLLENIINSSADYIYVKDLQLRTIICNETFARAVGKRPADLVGKTDIENGWPYEFVKGDPEKGIRGFEHDDLEALKGKIAHNENETVAIMGSLRTFDTIKLPLRDDNGELIGLLGISRDITDRIRTEESLLEINTNFRHLAENINEVFWLRDAVTDRIIYASPAYEKIWGRSVENLQGTTRSFLEDVHPDDLPKASLAREALRQKGEKFDLEYRVVRPDGGIRWVRARTYPVYDEDRRLIRYAGIAEDITERKLAEESVLESEERFGTIFEEAYIGIVIASPSFKFQKVNPAFCRMLGYSAEELCSMTFADVTHPDHIEQDFENVKKVGRGEIPFYRTEKRYVNKRGETIWGNLVVSSIHDKHGALRYYLSMIDDITERKAFEERNLVMLDVLKILNMQSGSTDAIGDIMRLIKIWTGIEAIGLRLRDGEDYPYCATDGFSEQFVEDERYLCRRDGAGNIVRDATGRCVLECMCGNVICGRIDASKPFFSRGGSFWTNSTTQLLAQAAKEDLNAETRNRCNEEGYECVALVPIRAGNEIIGLFQLNDRRTGLLKPDTIRFLEGIGSSIGIALARKAAEDKLVSAMREADILREKAEKAYREKELLLREVHHRIKNNMSTMMSLLSLQANTLKDPSAVSALEDAAGRMRSMGNLYDKLYRSDNLRELSVKDYFPSIIQEIVSVYPRSGRVKIKTAIDDFMLGEKILSPLSIIVNELITNAMKYAFAGKDDELMTVTAAIKDRHATVTIADNGAGLPESVDIEHSSGLGFKLVGMLTKQIGGTIRIERNRGTKFILEFNV